ncbi:hypothetical protein MNBD_IGNAVI01-1639, partial [hydrothermal vent metagenome]
MIKKILILIFSSALMLNAQD